MRSTNGKRRTIRPTFLPLGQNLSRSRSRRILAKPVEMNRPAHPDRRSRADQTDLLVPRPRHGQDQPDLLVAAVAAAMWMLGRPRKWRLRTRPAHWGKNGSKP